MKKIKKFILAAALLSFSVIAFMSCSGCKKGGGGNIGGGDGAVVTESRSGGVDTTPPAVTGITPGGAGVSAGGNVVITFSEAMDAEPGTVQLNNYPALSGGVWSSDKIFSIPFSGLAPGINCTVNVSGFKDKVGNEMTANDSHRFSTKALAAGLYKKAPEALTADDAPEVPFHKDQARETYTLALNHINSNPGTYTLFIDGDVSAASGGILSAGRTLYLSGMGGRRTIALSSAGFLFTLNSNAALVLGDNIRLRGHAANTSALVYVNAGKLTMKNGSAITGNNNTSADDNNSGGGVLVNGGTFIIEGGEVSGNTAKDGGGVYVKGAAAKFSMTGGSVKDNTINSDNGGGGVHIADGTFTMTGGEVKGNKNSNLTGGGGGVYVNGGTFTMSNGFIKENKAGWLGGGVFVWNGAFIMTGGEISGNTGSGGGGVLLYAHGNFTMSNGVIKGNSTGGGGYGGGVFVFGDNAMFTMTGGASISGNNAGSGGGVSLMEGALRMAGGTIYGSNAAGDLKNTSGVQGAALYISGSVTAERGTFSGGAFVPAGTLAAGNNTVKVNSKGGLE